MQQQHESTEWLTDPYVIQRLSSTKQAIRVQHGMSERLLMKKEQLSLQLQQLTQ
jgi:hypothetical protein